MNQQPPKRRLALIRLLSRLPHGRGVRQLIGVAAMLQGMAQFINLRGNTGILAGTLIWHEVYGIALAIIGILLITSVGRKAYTLYGRIVSALATGIYVSIAIDVLPSFASFIMALLLASSMIGEATHLGEDE